MNENMMYGMLHHTIMSMDRINRKLVLFQCHLKRTENPIITMTTSVELMSDESS